MVAASISIYQFLRLLDIIKDMVAAVGRKISSWFEKLSKVSEKFDTSNMELELKCAVSVPLFCSKFSLSGSLKGLKLKLKTK